MQNLVVLVKETVDAGMGTTTPLDEATTTASASLPMDEPEF